MLTSLLSTILPTFGIILVGWFARKVKIWDSSAVEVLNRYAYYLALPALIFESVKAIDLKASAGLDDAKLLGGALFAHALVLAIVWSATRLPGASKETRAVAPMLATLGSTAYLGIPYAAYAFGAEGTAYASLLSVALVVTLIFASTFFLNAYGNPRVRATSWHRILELPFLWAALAGLLWPLFNLPDLPAYANKFVAVLAGSAGPTALLAFGAFDYDIKLRDAPWMRAIALSAVKTFGAGLVSFLALRTFGVEGLRLAVGTAMGAVSVAITASILANEYRVGEKLTAATIAVSTGFSLIALTIISALYFGTSVFAAV